MRYLRTFILGGVDGVITSFAVVAGSDAGRLGRNAVLIVGLSSVFADGLSMGISEFLSTTSEQKLTPEANNAKPVVLGLVCLGSFVANGLVPIIVFVFANESLLSCAMFALGQLMVLGAARTYFTNENVLVGLAQTSLLGALAGGVSYGVATLAHSGLNTS